MSLRRCRAPALLWFLLPFAACTTVAPEPRDPLDALEWRSTKSRMYQDLAMQCLRAEDHTRARALLQQAVQFDPKDKSSLELLCRLAYTGGDHETARGAALLLSSLDPESVAAACTLGAVAEAGDHAEQAEAHYRAAMAHGRTDPRGGIDLHRFLLARGREAEATALRSDLDRRFPRAIETAIDHGAWLAAAGRWADAAVAFAAALATEPNDPAAATGFALATVMSREPARALELGGRLPPRARSDNPPLALLLATAHLRAGNRQQALRELDLAVPSGRNQARVRLLRAELLADLQHADLARAEFEQVLAAEPDQPRALAGLGRLHLAAGEPHAAVRAFEQAVRLQPDATPSHALLAAALLASGEPARAARHIAIVRAAGNATALVAELDRLSGAAPATESKK
jgi:Tfp pilus assembly protein PilF